MTIVNGQCQSSNYLLKKSKAERLYLSGNYYDAMKIYEDLLLTDSLNMELNYFTGVCKFNLKQFHEKFLSYGSSPVKDIRELMLKEMGN